jgi:hypothetical protein
MSSFTDPLEVQQISKNEWITLREFTYYVGEENSNDFIVVPKNTITDGASIPRIFWSIIGHPMGRYAQAAVLHDYMYRLHLRPRKECDDIFYEAMGVLKVADWKRNIMYISLRLFGFVAYNRGNKYV